MEDKVYWSEQPDPKKWFGSGDYLTFFLVPRRWWSIKEWKLANSLRAEMLRKYALLLGEAR